MSKIFKGSNILSPPRLFSNPQNMAKAPDSSLKESTDMAAIKQWVEARGGTPATVARTNKPNEIGILRIKFTDEQVDLKEITWEDFEKKIKEANLKFIYQEELKNGNLSRFFKFVKNRD